MTANWTTPITWNVDQLVTDDDLNEQVRDNLEYLLSPNHQRIIHDNGSTYSLTNVTTFQDIDSTNLSIDLETHGGPVLVHFQAVAYAGSSGNEYAMFDIAVDGVQVGTGFSRGLLTAKDNVFVPLSLHVLITGLSAGTHNLRPQWRTSTGDTAYILADSTTSAVIFEAIEL